MKHVSNQHKKSWIKHLRMRIKEYKVWRL